MLRGWSLRMIRWKFKKNQEFIKFTPQVFDLVDMGKLISSEGGLYVNDFFITESEDYLTVLECGRLDD